MVNFIIYIFIFFNVQNYQTMRTEMVSNQIKARGVNDPAVLRAMENVERHKFVPDDIKHLAYEDTPLPIGYQQTISQPYIVAYMTEQLQLKAEDKVLEIGTGSGYQAAILAAIVKEVYTVEIVKALGLQARSVLKEEGFTNIKCKIGDGYHGWKEHAPYDAIIVTAAPQEIPKELLNQLAEGGRLIIPVEDSYNRQQLVLYKKANDKIKKKYLLPVRFVPFTRE